jgi:hypothetical protein
MDMTGNSSITLEVVADKQQLRRFLKVPHHIYADDPAWIAPLDFEQKQRFSPKNHFFQHARWCGWVASRDGIPVGRITAQVDELHQRQYADGLGYFGMIEAVDDAEVFSTLFAAAENWLREQGMRRVRGPYNLHVNEELGLLVEGFDTPPYVLMGHGSPWYAAAVEGQGYAPVKDLLAYKVDPNFEAPPVMAKLIERVSDRVVVRKLRRDKLLEEADIMREIFNDAWGNNWGFVPLDPESWLDTVKTLTALMPDDYIQISELDGEPVAFIVGLPNINEASRDLGGKLLPFGWLKLLWRLKVKHLSTARVPLMGVKQEYQHSRLGTSLTLMGVDRLRKVLHASGVEEVEMGWILEDNGGMRNIIETVGGKIYKRYRMYEKEL